MIQSTTRAWGGYFLDLELPAAKIRLAGLSARQRESLLGEYSDFAATYDYPLDELNLVCNAYRLGLSPSVPAEELSKDGQYTLRKQRWLNGIDLTGINFEGRIDLSSSSGQSSLGTQLEDELPQAIVIENFLRVFAAHHALGQGGVILHSAGLVFDGLAYVFSGRSNVGKTTLTAKAHANGAWVLSDDINLVLPHNQDYQAHAVPFTGEFGRTLQHVNGRKSYPLAGIILLEQSYKLEAVPVSPASAVAGLITACPFVNDDPEEFDTLFEVLTQLVSRVPVIRLSNRRNDPIEDIMKIVQSEIDRAKVI